jgi:hypothetical protein
MDSDLKMPLVGVVTPVFNGGKTLRVCVEKRSRTNIPQLELCSVATRQGAAASVAGSAHTHPAMSLAAIQGLSIHV